MKLSPNYKRQPSIQDKLSIMSIEGSDEYYLYAVLNVRNKKNRLMCKAALLTKDKEFILWLGRMCVNFYSSARHTHIIMDPAAVAELLSKNHTQK